MLNRCCKDFFCWCSETEPASCDGIRDYKPMVAKLCHSCIQSSEVDKQFILRLISRNRPDSQTADSLN